MEEQIQSIQKFFYLLEYKPLFATGCACKEWFKLYKGTGKSSEAVHFCMFYYGLEIGIMIYMNCFECFIIIGNLEKCIMADCQCAAFKRANLVKVGEKGLNSLVWVSKERGDSLKLTFRLHQRLRVTFQGPIFPEGYLFILWRKNRNKMMYGDQQAKLASRMKNLVHMVNILSYYSLCSSYWRMIGDFFEL